MRNPILNRRVWQSLIFIFIIVTCVATIVSISNNQRVGLVNGYMDLRNVNIEESNVSLFGEWEFYDNMILETLSDKDIGYNRILNVPDIWKDTKAPFGTGAYRAVIRVSDINRIYGIKLPIISSASSVYINGELICTNGNVSDDVSEYKGSWDTKVRYFNTDSEEIEIIVNVANYSHIKGGMVWGSISFGTQENIHRLRARRQALTFLICGFLIALGAYHLLIYLHRFKKKKFLCFGLFCLMMTLRIMVTGDNLFNEVFYSLPLELHAKLEYMTIPLGSLFFIMYLAYSSKTKLYKNRIFLFSKLYLVAYTLLIVSTRLYVYSRLLGLTYIIIFYFTIVEILDNYKRTEKCVEEDITFYAGLIFAISIINDILYTYSLLNSYYIYVGLLALIIGHTIKMSIEVARNYEQIENWSKALNEEVKIRTKEINEVNEKLYFIATRDPLTELYNRQYLEQWISNYKNSKNINNVTILYLDLDNFKYFNDEYGHVLGDIIIREFSDIIRHATGNKGYPFRMGGDEFVIILPNKTGDVGSRLANNILSKLTETEMLENRIKEYIGTDAKLKDNSITCSIGIAEAEYYMDIHELIHIADQNMIEAKDKGKNTFVLDMKRYTKEIM